MPAGILYNLRQARIGQSLWWRGKNEICFAGDRGSFDARGIGCRNRAISHRNGRGDGYRDRGRSGATFFIDDDFKGRSVYLDHPVRSFRMMGMNDKISSIDIQSGRWLVCVDDNFEGRCQVIDRSVGKLSRFGLDDKISSARPLSGNDR